MFKPHLITLYQELIGLDLAFAFAGLSLVTFQIISILTIIITFLYQRQLKAEIINTYKSSSFTEDSKQA